ncbi:fibrinogen C domain-containing protein 1-like [Mya arenaria]|uniref:fibrinogen C domain-containing protein 1-like n=1 Tax=Mya arenaria TaxID=6604 RepID=UPI0022E01B24|nr:fibrinogen C domain-containing protein 1-like [Mya arenaria]
MLLKVIPIYFFVIASVVPTNLAARTSRLMTRVDALDKKLALLEDKVRQESEYHREDMFDIQTQFDEIKAGNASGMKPIEADLMDKAGEELTESDVVALLKEVLGWQVAVAKAFQSEKKLNGELRNEIDILHQNLENVKTSVELLVDANKEIQTELTEQTDVMKNEIDVLKHSIKSTVDVQKSVVQNNLTNVQKTLKELEDNMVKAGELYNELNETVLDNKRYLEYLIETDFKSKKKENKTEVKKLKSCNEALASGVSTIYPSSFPNGIPVYCEKMADTEKSYLVFHRRQDGSVNFQRNYSDFVSGFGERDGEFWLGLETLHKLTTSEDYSLRVNLMDFEGNKAYAEYSTFNIGSEDSGYKLSLGKYSGTAGNSMDDNNGSPFTGPDNASKRCANWGSSWWFNSCSYSNLNGYYFHDPQKAPPNLSIWQGVRWDGFKSWRYSLKFAEMKIRLK